MIVTDVKSAMSRRWFGVDLDGSVVVTNKMYLPGTVGISTGLENANVFCSNDCANIGNDSGFTLRKGRQSAAASRLFLLLLGQ